MGAKSIQVSEDTNQHSLRPPELKPFSEIVQCDRLKIFVEQHPFFGKGESLSRGQLYHLRQLIFAEPGKKVSVSDHLGIYRERDSLLALPNRNFTQATQVIEQPRMNEIIQKGWHRFELLEEVHSLDFVKKGPDLLPNARLLHGH